MANRRLKQVDFHGEVGLDFDTIAFAALASILATVALLTGSIPILIGAMVLAPTFDPLIAIPFGLVTHNVRLVGVGLLNTALLFIISLAVCLATVYLVMATLAFPPIQGLVGIEMIRDRLDVKWSSPLVAFVAGAGGALAFASERRIHVVGVVIAVALVPSLAAAAIGFLASPLSGWGGLSLFGVNVAGIIVAGYLVLLVRVKTGEVQEQHDRHAND